MRPVSFLALLLTSGFLFSIQGQIIESTWKAKEKGHRYTLPGSLLISATLSRPACGSACLQRQDCISFNHNKGSMRCELLNTAFHRPSDTTLIAAPGWNYYNFLPPGPPKNASDYCPSGGVYVQYEQPIYKRYNYSIDGYTCSPHPWVIARHNEGKTCKMVIMYDTDFKAAPTAYNHRPEAYYQALGRCMTYNCNAMLCKKYSDNCWLKLNSHLSSASQTIPGVDLLYWYTVCQ